MIVYKTTNRINGKIYIGKDEKVRPNYFGSGKYYRRAEKKYGKINFIKTIIDFADNRKDACLKEIFWINFYDARNPEVGYNICPGGEGFTGRHSEETKQKMKRPTSDETKRKISIALKGKRHSHEYGQRISASRKGMKFSEETKQKLSAAKTGIRCSEETKQKISKSLTGCSRPTYKRLKEKVHESIDNNCNV